MMSLHILDDELALFRDSFYFIDSLTINRYTVWQPLCLAPFIKKVDSCCGCRMVENAGALLPAPLLLSVRLLRAVCMMGFVCLPQKPDSPSFECSRFTLK